MSGESVPVVGRQIANSAKQNASTQTLFKVVYLAAIAISTIGWLWLLTRWAIELMA